MLFLFTLTIQLIKLHNFKVMALFIKMDILHVVHY